MKFIKKIAQGFTKVGHILSTLIPTTKYSFTKEKGAYMLVLTNVWCGRVVVMKTPVKDLV